MSVHFTSRGKATMTLRFRNAVAALALLSAEASAQEQPLTTKCESAPLMAAWTEFGEKGKVAVSSLSMLSCRRSNPTRLSITSTTSDLLGLGLASHVAAGTCADRHPL